MNKNEISIVILDYIKAHEGTSYVEIEQVFEDNGFDFRGCFESCAASNENVVFWAGWSEEAFAIIDQLLRSGEIERTPCDPFIYLIDGGALRYPVLRRNPERIRSCHWLPCLFSVRRDRKEK